MSFFDRKEEVLEIQLTPHGRYLLSLGEFQPVYYSFFDDDIVYDSNYIGYSEAQNSTEDRIKEASRSHCQANYRTVEISSANVYVYDGRNLQNYFEREYALSSELGIADYYSDNAPAWVGPELCDSSNKYRICKIQKDCRQSRPRPSALVRRRRPKNDRRVQKCFC